ncbi:MAG TPA: tetratricopeptide repeat protein [Ktedonobacteraceae bacterium]|nr:tetratricopeptide repeat protein [Ktedonobacteraceae bacterium]
MATSSSRPSLWNVPYQRNPYFTGRGDMLSQLYKALHAERAIALSHPQGVSGLGGIGKTQTVLEYAYRYAGEYEAVFWVHADSTTSLISSFLELARLLELPERHARDQRRAVDAVLLWLRQHARWLLIFDNMDEPQLAEPFLPRAASGHIIFTTRARAIHHFARRLEVKQMDEETGALLLLRRASLLPLQALLEQAAGQERKLACAISHELDGLPLALDQAGAYVKETPCTLADYLRLYQQRQQDLLSRRSRENQEYPASVATTWSLSFEKVARANPAATDLMTLCAFLAPEAIPESIIVSGAPYLGEILAPLAKNEHLFNLACQEALRYSLIARQADARILSMHRLVQSILRANVPEKDRDGWRLVPAGAVKRRTVATQREWKQRAVLAVSAAGPHVEDIAAWEACDLWVPHTIICANWIEQERFYFQESTDMLNKAGHYLDARARYAEAETLIKSDLAICEQLFDPMHPYIMQSLNNLGDLYYHMGRYDMAEALLTRALAICEYHVRGQRSSKRIELSNRSAFWESKSKQGPPALFQRHVVITQENLAEMLNNLAMVYESWGKHNQAVAMMRRVQSIYAQQAQSVSPHEVQNLSNIATIYVGQGKYAEAEALFSRVLTMQKQLLGTNHPDVATTLNNLGQVYKYQGKRQEAALLLKEALGIREQTLGSAHPDTAMNLDNLAVIYYEQGDQEQAEGLWKRALAIWESHAHPDAAYTYNNLAILYKEQRKYDEAEAQLKRAIAVCERFFGPGEVNLVSSLTNLALLYEDQRHFQKAIPLLERALAIREQQLGADHPETLVSRRNLETVRHNQKILGQQPPNSQAPIRPREPQRPAPGKAALPAPDSVPALRARAALFEGRKQYAEAEELYARALALQEQELGTSHLEVAAGLLDLARFYKLQEKYQAAEPPARRASVIRQQTLGSMHPDTALSLLMLADIFLAQKKYKQAEVQLKRALLICEKVFGADHPHTRMARNDYARVSRLLDHEQQS